MNQINQVHALPPVPLRSVLILSFHQRVDLQTCLLPSGFTTKNIYIGKGKGKAIPLQAWTGPEGSRRVRLPDFKTIGT
jgi:hypothetical protein